MKQFSLDKWLENQSRKVVTRNGRPVRILCTDAKAKDGCCIIAAIETDGEEEGYQFYEDGRAYSSKSCIEDCADLFFADEDEMIRKEIMDFVVGNTIFKDGKREKYLAWLEKQGEVKESVIFQHENITCKKNDDSLTDEEPETIEIPFGGKDSEFIKDEYFIPEGCKARIEGNKVIIEKIQREDELTEFEQKLVEILKSEGAPIGNIEKFTDKDKEYFHCYSKQLLDLARKELQPEFDKEMDKLLKETDKIVEQRGYKRGREDALKDLPKWKKATENMEFDKHVLLFEDEVLTTQIFEGEYYIEADDLKTLPKE